MSNVKVRFETAMLGYQWGAEVEVTRTPLINACIEEGRLTVLDELSDAPPAQDVSGPAVDVDLRGQLLDDALDAAGLSKAGSADEKRARLAAHRAQVAGAAGAEQQQPTAPAVTLDKPSD